MQFCNTTKKHTHKNNNRTCLFVQLFTFFCVRFKRKKKKCLEREREREGERASERGGGITQNATRIRWDPTPETEKRQELERRVRGRKETKKKKRGKDLTFSLLTTRF